MKIFSILLKEPVLFNEINLFSKKIEPNEVLYTLEDRDDRTYQCESEKIANAIKEKYGAEITIIEYDTLI